MTNQLFQIRSVAQEFIFTRGDLYSSEMLLLQYSVPAGQKKSDLDYTGVKEALLIVLMVESSRLSRIPCTSSMYVTIEMEKGIAFKMKSIAF